VAAFSRLARFPASVGKAGYHTCGDAMMQIPVRIAPSKIEGLGLFAVHDIPKGTLLWKYQEPIDSKIKGMCRASPEWERHIERYTFKPHGFGYLILCGDAGMFWNHSDTPNCADPEDGNTYAARDIHAGEELTSDYRVFDSRPMPWMRL
jgi:SET domain-containing protein